ncbi:leucine-rich repeat domain-containing protein, partial [Falsiroseomonas sp.]|uniref:leucine-rich repeat domain-containing protein n=1 Tax=Falsiroseomonas sp. TaxID=2870721 RepID=UPI003F726F13
MTHRLSGFPGGKAGKGGKQVAERAFHELLAGHLDAGTRPGLTAGAVGGKWTAVAFGKAVRVSDRTVRNWRTTGKGTRPSAETLEFILDALFGDDATLRAERLELQDAWDRGALADAEPEPDGAIFVEGEERLELQQGTADDDAVARQPGIARRQALIVEKLQDLVEALGNRLDNQRGWRPLPRTAQRLLAALENMPPEAIPAQLVELYDRTMSLASFVDQDDALGSAQGATDDPLEPDLRRALADALSSLAPWLRSFPSVVQWDSARQDALTRPELFAAVRAQLDDARALIRLAGEANALSAEDVALANEPLETARRDGFQAEKAAYRGLATARNLLTRATGIRALALTAAFYSGAVASDFSTKSTVAQTVSTFLATAEGHALRLAKGMPGEVAAAIRHVLTRRADDEGRSDGEPALPATEQRQRPEGFDLEAVKRLVLASEAPPAEWRPFIVELDLSQTQIADLSPLSGLSSLKSLDLRGTQVADVSPLAGLASLQSLNLMTTQVADVSPLAGLSSLQSLKLWGTKVADLSPLSGLSSLQSLDLMDTQVVDVSPLSGLSSLRLLNLWGTLVADISPLSGLSSLQSLDLIGTQVADVSPISGLSGLQSLNLWGTLVADVSPLAGLSGLQLLNLWGTKVADVSPLSGLSSLQSLNLWDTQVADVSPLSGLTSLQTLDLAGTKIADVSPLSGLSSLQSLNLRDTQVSDVSPLSGLSSLQTLNLWGTKVADVSPLSGLSGLQSLNLWGTKVADVSPLSGLTSL